MARLVPYLVSTVIWILSHCAKVRGACPSAIAGMSAGISVTAAIATIDSGLSFVSLFSFLNMIVFEAHFFAGDMQDRFYRTLRLENGGLRVMLTILR